MTTLVDAPRPRAWDDVVDLTPATVWPLPPAWTVTRTLLCVVAALVSLSLAGQYSKYALGHPQVKGFVPLFYVDLESNVPTWYSSIAIAGSACLLMVIAAARQAQRDPFAHQWKWLAAIFMLLSLDEIAMLHEYPIDPLRESLQAGGFLYYTWVLPGLAFVAAVGIWYFRFLLHLPRATRWGMLAAAGVFVGSAIVIEMLSGWQADHFGEETWGYALVVTAEETCEMVGIVIFIHTLVQYLHRHCGRLHLALAR